MTALIVLSQPAFASDHARLDKGEIIIRQRAIPGSDMPKTILKAVIDAPLLKIQAKLDKCANYKNFMPRTKDSTELSRVGKVVTCRVVIDMPFPLDDLSSVTRAVHTVKKDYFQRAWTMVKGTYKYNTGGWILTPFGSSGARTLVVYSVHAEPKTTVPLWLQKKATRSSLPALIKALAKESGAKPRGD